jgi:hypothetical protein
MGKRPYYLITHNIDCDGYNTYIDYLGVNGQAAVERFRHLVEEIKTRYFINEGIDEDHIFYGGERGVEGYLNFSLADINEPGKAYTVYLNDDNCCWINVKIMVIETGEFFRYPSSARWDNGRTVWSDNVEREEQYRREHPNAKY